jgi:mannose-1-phosphate guanylyltransferase
MLCITCLCCLWPQVLVAPTAKIGADCKLGPDVSIGEGCVIGDGVRLSNCVIMRGVTVGHHTKVGWGAATAAGCVHSSGWPDNTTAACSLISNAPKLLGNRKLKCTTSPLLCTVHADRLLLSPVG